MRKCQIIVFFIVILFVFTACNNGNTNGGGSLLAKEDFDVYQEGTSVALAGDRANSSVFFSIFADENQMTAETKKGIRIGDPIEKLAEQYKGVPSYLYSTGLPEDQELAYDGKDFAEFVSKEPEAAAKEYTVTYELYAISGQPTDDSEKIEAMLQDTALAADSEYYYLTFFVQGGVVEDILVKVEDPILTDR